jgi:hypothetical protein
VTVIVPVSEDEACALIDLLKYGRETIALVERGKQESVKLSGLRVTMAINYTIERSPYYDA